MNAPIFTDKSRDQDSSEPVQGTQLRKTLSLVTIAWLFGSTWANATGGTPLTNYAAALNASKFEFGVLAALPFLASFLAVPGSLLIERTGKRKLIFLIGLYLNRVMWIPIALVPIWLMNRLGTGSTHTVMITFLVLMFVMHAAGQMGGVGWAGWMADIVPERIRGRYFSRRRQWAILPGIFAAGFAGWLLDKKVGTGNPNVAMYWCATLFIVAAFFGMADIASFHWVKDVPQAPKRGAHVLAAWREPLHNPQFLWFAGFVGTFFFAISFMGQFSTLYIMQQLGGGAGHARSASVNTITQMMLIVAPSAAQLLVLGVWGRAADRMGKRPLLMLAGLGLVPVALGWCFVTRETIWLGYVLAALGAALWAGVETANFNIVLEMSGTGVNGETKGGTAYVALNGLIINIAGCLGGLSAGVIAELLKDWSIVVPLVGAFTCFHVLFVLSAVMRLLAVVIFLPHVKEEGSRPAVEALRFMTTNFYNNLFGAVSLPLKLVGWRRAEVLAVEAVVADDGVVATKED